MSEPTIYQIRDELENAGVAIGKAQTHFDALEDEIADLHSTIERQDSDLTEYEERIHDLEKQIGEKADDA